MQFLDLVNAHASEPLESGLASVAAEYERMVETAVCECIEEETGQGRGQFFSPSPTDSLLVGISTTYWAAHDCGLTDGPVTCGLAKESVDLKLGMLVADLDFTQAVRDDAASEGKHTNCEVTTHPTSLSLFFSLFHLFPVSPSPSCSFAPMSVSLSFLHRSIPVSHILKPSTFIASK